MAEWAQRIITRKPPPRRRHGYWVRICICRHGWVALLHLRALISALLPAHLPRRLTPALPADVQVQAAAADILVALQQLRLFPRVLIGHSFGGKVVMGMVQQFGQKLPYPVQVRWGWEGPGRGWWLGGGPFTSRCNKTTLLYSCKLAPCRMRSGCDCVVGGEPAGDARLQASRAVPCPAAARAATP